MQVGDRRKEQQVRGTEKQIAHVRICQMTEENDDPLRDPRERGPHGGLAAVDMLARRGDGVRVDARHHFAGFRWPFSSYS